MVVNGDAEQLPFRNASFDLVVSTSALQWVGSLSDAIHELRRVMKPGASLYLAFFCDGTLYELQRCFLEAIGSRCGKVPLEKRLHRFWSIEDLKTILSAMDFEKVVVNCEVETDFYPDLKSLLRSIKNIGAGSVSSNTEGGLGWRGIINETSRLYRDYYGENGRIPATYRVLYLQAQVAHS